MQRRLYSLLILSFCSALSAKTLVEPSPIGNFSVPLVTQISPLISFGQLLIGKNALLPQFSGEYTKIENGYLDNIEPNIIYGILDDLSILLEVPFTPKSQNNGSHSAGFEDLLLQLEYGLYSKTRTDYTLQATLVGNIQAPTGSNRKIPLTGNGSFTYFLGTTFAYLSANWYAFASPGVNLTTSRHHTKIGNSYLYQWGVARYIKQLSPPNWIFDIMLEFDGTYAEKNIVNGSAYLNSGGNTLVMTPSVWLSSKYIILQWGMGFPIVQSLNGNQSKTNYSISYNLGVGLQF
jgi:hypothetical protein